MGVMVPIFINPIFILIVFFPCDKNVAAIGYFDGGFMRAQINYGVACLRNRTRKTKERSSAIYCYELDKHSRRRLSNIILIIKGTIRG